MPKRFVENAMKDYMGKKSGQIPDHPAQSSNWGTNLSYPLAPLCGGISTLVA